MKSERKPEKGFMIQKKKYEKSAPTETKYLTIENVEKVTSIRQWKKGTTFIFGDTMLPGIEEKRISGHDSYDYLKALRK